MYIYCDLILKSIIECATHKMLIAADLFTFKSDGSIPSLPSFSQFYIFIKASLRARYFTQKALCVKAIEMLASTPHEEAT